MQTNAENASPARRAGKNLVATLCVGTPTHDTPRRGPYRLQRLSDLPRSGPAVRSHAARGNEGNERGKEVLLAVASLLVLCFLGSAYAQAQKDKKAANTPAPADVHDPARAVANLDVHKDLQATLFAAEPAVVSVTNLDVDHRGRVWVCEVVNYRKNNGRRPQGDRILILEDADGDGTLDTSKVFYQGRDVDSAIGICVLGKKVFVSASPNIIVFTDEDGDDKPDKKEVFFTKTGQAQHDHSAHSIVFGPDGKFYWNFGNSGKAVHDKNGRPVVDQAGHTVADNGKPYSGGMVFRCNPDGSAFEVLAHNFRNNYEIAVDSFGTLWQSDNDDDGNRGVRINYVMESGNYGYLDEMTLAGWQSKRTNLEADVPSRHWHQNDPGVVPNLLQTGAGSPTGICVYEGNLLPEVFRNQVIHCDAGPSVVRAYPAAPNGAGYQAEIVNILDGRRHNWFRPADVCVAPDGSLFVTDWYDPGVGGHLQKDLGRGRIFRVAPPGSKYQAPKFDFASADGAVEALKNPNLATRYLAWSALHEMKLPAEPALLKLWQSDNPRFRARALWLLGKIEGRGRHYVDLALKDPDPDIRGTGIRLARQLDLDLPPLIATIVRDPAPLVRRECAVALRHCPSPRAAELWAELARQHDGKDRWYLEALGIGAHLHWDACFDAWLKAAGAQWNTPAGRDIIWRSRAAKTPDYLARIIADSSIPAGQLPRYFRAFDFQKAEGTQELLLQLAFASPAAGPRQELIVAESLLRLKKGFDPNKNPKQLAAIERLLDRNPESLLFVDMVSKFDLAPRYPALLALARKKAEDQLGVNAVRALLDKGQTALIDKGLRDKDADLALNTAKVLGTSADARIVGLLLPIVRDEKQPLDLRRQALRSLARTYKGAHKILEMTRDKQLPEELKATAGVALNSVTWRDLKQPIAELFPLPPAKNNEKLPPISELVNRKGNIDQGKTIYNTIGTCASCHMVNGTGKEVGPNLSEIGAKLGREALYESILYPSAGISHNYEMYVVETKNGTAQSGVLVSQTPDEVALKGADAIVRAFKRAEIEEMKQSPVSLMPADLHKVLTAQDLADLVEYMLALKKAEGK